MNLSNMVIVITGASKGIGEATALYLAKKGHQIYSLARTTKEDGGNIHYLICDVTNCLQIKECFEKIYANEKRIDAVITCAGIGISNPFEYEEEEYTRKLMDVNLYGTIETCKISIPYLKESKGSIVTIGSIAGELAIPFQTSYSMSKAAIHRFSEALSNELRPFFIKVRCIMPGDIKTCFTQNRIRLHEENEYQTRLKRSIAKMEEDEQHGSSPLIIAKCVDRLLKRKDYKVKFTCGFIYHLFLFLNRILPSKLIQFILYLIYGK